MREALATGQADAALSNTIEAPRWAQGLTGIELLGPLTRDVVALYVRADRAELEARLDAWLLEQERAERSARCVPATWGLGREARPHCPCQALLAATAERLALMPWVAAAKQRRASPSRTCPGGRVLAASRQSVRSAAGALDRAPPPDEALDAFFQAQIDAAKGVQRRASFDAGDPPRLSRHGAAPAMARISDRMAGLVARLPEGLDEATVLALAQDWLGSSGLEAAELERIARTLAALRPRPASGVSLAPDPIRSGPGRAVLPGVWDTHSARMSDSEKEPKTAAADGPPPEALTVIRCLLLDHPGRGGHLGLQLGAREVPGSISIPTPGQTLAGRYMVFEQLGQGGMGVVLAAYDTRLDRRVALKLLRSHEDAGYSASDGEARLVREAQAMARLNHPHVVAVYDAGRWRMARSSSPWSTWRGRRCGSGASEQPRSWREVLDAYLAAGRGLAAAHAAGPHPPGLQAGQRAGGQGRPRPRDGLRAGAQHQPGGRSHRARADPRPALRPRTRGTAPSPCRAR